MNIEQTNAEYRRMLARQAEERGDTLAAQKHTAAAARWTYSLKRVPCSACEGTGCSECKRTGFVMESSGVGV